MLRARLIGEKKLMSTVDISELYLFLDILLLFLLENEI